MTTRQPQVHTQLGRAAVQIFAANDRMNQVLIEHLDPAAWRAKPPGKARTIAAIFTHMHNVRCKWVRLTAPHLKIPPQLNRARCTPQQVRAGLAESATRCAEMLAEALGGGEGRGREVSQRRLGSALAGWPGNAVLHACSRSPPSRAGVYARPSARIPVAQRGGVRALELGKTVERVRIARRPRRRFIRTRPSAEGAKLISPGRTPWVQIPHHLSGAPSGAAQICSLRNGENPHPSTSLRQTDAFRYCVPLLDGY